MHIVQAVFGVFHHFELARELDRRGHLDRIYSTWPWARLKREGLSRARVETFPWIHTPDYLLTRAGLNPRRLADHLGYANALAFDTWTRRKLARSANPCDAFIAISGAGLATGALVQQRGGVFICDRGSTHQRFQEEIVSDEFRRWGISRPVSDPRDTAREEQIYAQADAITVPSTAAARSFASMGVDPAKVHVVPYGVRLENFYPVGKPSPGSFTVLFAGSVGLRKGVPYLLQAFAKVRHPNKTLIIAGDMQPELRPLLNTLPLFHVEQFGSISQERLRELMGRSHVLVLPSIEEGLALVQAQAMACGCPVICTTNTGGEDLFTDGVEGYIVPIRDADAIADRLQQIADSPALRQRLSTAALERVRHLGGWSTYGDRWEQLLLGLTGR